MKLSGMADAMDVHPFMLSRWRKEARTRCFEGSSPAVSRSRPPCTPDPLRDSSPIDYEAVTT